MSGASSEKGLDVLAAAFRLAAQSHPDLELVLVGEGPYRTTLHERLRGTKHRFLGPLTGATLAGAYASADMFCLPSRTETFGQVVLEAAASGLPVVVTDRGGAHESVIADETGLVVPADDAYVEAIRRLAADPELRRRLGGCRGRLQATTRTGWPELFEQLAASYHEVVNPTTRSRAQHDPVALAPVRPQ